MSTGDSEVTMTGATAHGDSVFLEFNTGFKRCVSRSMVRNYAGDKIAKASYLVAQAIQDANMAAGRSYEIHHTQINDVAKRAHSLLHGL